MNNTIDATYFGGQSSVSQKTTVVFNERMNEFRLQIVGGISFVWKLDDLLFEQYGSLLEIRNEKYSGVILKIDNKDFSQKFYNAIKKNKGIDIHTRLLNIGFSKIVAIAICFLSFIMLAYFYVLPTIAEKTVPFIPDSFDNKIGDVFMETFLADNDIDTTKTKYLEQFVSELNLKTKKPLRFLVVNSEEINAFALPNGQIVVFTAILDNMKSSDELVALLGHEISHVNHRHSTKILCRSLAGYMMVSLLLSDVNGIMAVLADNAQQLHSLSYSREFEKEADEQGLKILMDNNINPNGMVQLFEQLEKEEKFSIPKIISSHPLTKERKENIQKIISETVYQVKPNDKLNSLFESIKH
jgi:predicted Zn-dependent protease